MPLLYTSTILVREICWACKGTGHIFAGVNPIRFRKCYACYGYRGRGVMLNTMQPQPHSS